MLILSKWLNRSIWPKAWILSGTTNLGHCEPKSNGNEGYAKFPKVPGVESHHEIQFSVKNRTLVRGGGSYPSAEVQLAYFAVPTDRVTFHFFIT